ncbi:alpha/beta hydrolase [Pseudoalteromonas aliena]|uniref:alpha/beta hydrolase n=1 Tax=Pseudoalteromonas aliena TaxID=247523 RepID=UPI0024952C93|nr:alpha/beta hydrolase-fold protein [Pseudoalteromonas aliena]
MKYRNVYQLIAAFIFASLFAAPVVAVQIANTSNGYEQHTRVLASKALAQERTVTIQLPKSYHKNPDKKYPVIYRLDGKENLAYMTPVLAHLHTAFTKAAPEVIIVAIENTDRLKDLYPTKNEEPAGPIGLGGGAARFLEFIETELIPLVNEKYRTHDFKVISGASAAGVFVLYVLQTNPDLFQAHIAYSPAVWWNYGATAKSTKAFFANSKTFPNYLYMNIGQESGIMRERYDDMNMFLKANTPKALTFISESFDNVPHGLTFAAGAFNAYQKLFLPLQMPVSAYTGETHSIATYYQRLSAQHGEEIAPQESMIRGLGYHFVNTDELDQAIKIFKFGISLYPNTADAYNGLAYGYESSGMYQESLEQVKKALALVDKNYLGYDVYLARKNRLVALLQQ